MTKDIATKRKERFKLAPCAVLFLKRDNKLLLIKRENTGWADGKYALPEGSL